MLSCVFAKFLSVVGKLRTRTTCGVLEKSLLLVFGKIGWYHEFYFYETSEIYAGTVLLVHLPDTQKRIRGCASPRYLSNAIENLGFRRTY